MVPVFDRAGVFSVRDDLFFGRGVRDAGALRDILAALGVAAGPVLIKPNWFSPLAGQFTDAGALTLLCDAVAGEKIIIEGHAAARNDNSREITPDNGRENWRWLREQEQAYFTRFGLDAVLARDDVTYVNVTDEIWEGRAAPEEDVRAALGEKGHNLAFAELYGALPAKLLEWRGRPLLSFARVKVPDATRPQDAFSLSLKNMFGLIPEPNRGAYHERLPDAVTDVHLLYGAYFHIIGICEGINHVVRVHDAGALQTPWGDRYDDVEGLGLVVAGARAAEADAFAAALFGVDLSARALMKAADERLGRWDKMVALEASRYGLET